MRKSLGCILANLACVCLIFAPRASADGGLPPLPDLESFGEMLADAPAAPPIRPFLLKRTVVAAAAQGPAPALRLPDSFTIKEKVLSWTDTFLVKGGGKDLGRITEKIFSLTKSFTYKDASGNVVAKARAKLLSWGNQVIVTDARDRKIGTIKEEILKSWWKVYTVYKILDADGRQIAESEKVDWIGTSFTLRSLDGRVIATLKRPWLNILSDSWEVEIRDHEAVDSRLIVMIAAYKTSVDNDRRAEEDDSSDKKSSSSSD